MQRAFRIIDLSKCVLHVNLPPIEMCIHLPVGIKCDPLVYPLKALIS